MLRGAAALPLAAAPERPLRIACDMPVGRIDPLTVSQTSGLLMLAQTGEFLLRVAPDGSLRPMLAVHWESNEDATLWRFRLRPGVRFHDGTVLNAGDVVATMDRLSDPAQASNALSVFRSVLSPGGTRAAGPLAVEFRLDAPDGHFPYAVSSDNYNAIILPAGRAGDWEADFIGTGPFRLAHYTPTLGARFERNPDWWGGAVRPAATEFLFFADQQPQILALLGDEADIVAQFVVSGARGLLDDPACHVIRLPSAAHRQIHMRTDRPPFADARVRRAVALSLDRPAILSGLLYGQGVLGNDSPCAPIYPETDLAVPQRAANPGAARRLLAEAGQAGGIAATLVTERLQEIPDLAVIVQQACAAIGIALEIRVEDPALYYGTAQRGSSDWLDSDFGITDYGHRAVPDVLLQAGFASNGAWNAAHFRDPRCDSLIAAYRAARTAAARRAASRAIQELLLAQTPVIIPYFFDFLVATRRDVTGVSASAIGQLFLAGAGRSAA